MSMSIETLEGYSGSVWVETFLRKHAHQRFFHEMRKTKKKHRRILPGVFSEKPDFSDDAVWLRGA